MYHVCVVDRVETNTDVMTDVMEELIGLLLTIKELINMPSKYDMCVRCLSPCLKTGNWKMQSKSALMEHVLLADLNAYGEEK